MTRRTKRERESAEAVRFEDVPLSAHMVRAGMGYSVVVALHADVDGTRKEVDLAPVLDLSWTDAKWLLEAFHKLFRRQPRGIRMTGAQIRKLLRGVRSTLRHQQEGVARLEKEVARLEDELRAVPRTRPRSDRRRLAR